MKRITVLLAEDHNVVRQGLRAILNDEQDIVVIGEATNGRQAVELTRFLHPDVVIMDIGMPLLNGLEATRQILKLDPMAKVLILSANGDDESIGRVFPLGAAGYLLKHTSAEYLSDAIREVIKGNCVYSSAVSKKIRERSTILRAQNKSTLTTRASCLTSREVELVQLVAEGQMNKEIARELEISVKTVEKHWQRAMNKLDIHDIAGLTRYAIAARIVECSRTNLRV